MRRIVLAALVAALPGAAMAAPGASSGIVEKDAARRGFEVYQQVCSVCHALSHVELGDVAGLGLSGKQLAEIAAGMQVAGPPDASGAPTSRAGRLSDRLLSRFPDEASARAANGGALPPDLSDIAATRPGGAPRIATLLSSYGDPPAGVTVPQGLYWNKSTRTHLIAMPPPLADDAVTYADGTKATLAQETHDVAAFLAWSADPHVAARRWVGGGTIGFLVVLGALVFALKRRVWSRV